MTESYKVGYSCINSSCICHSIASFFLIIFAFTCNCKHLHRLFYDKTLNSICLLRQKGIVTAIFMNYSINFSQTRRIISASSSAICNSPFTNFIAIWSKSTIPFSFPDFLLTSFHCLNKDFPSFNLCHHINGRWNLKFCHKIIYANACNCK